MQFLSETFISKRFWEKLRKFGHREKIWKNIRRFFYQNIVLAGVSDCSSTYFSFFFIWWIERSELIILFTWNSTCGINILIDNRRLKVFKVSLWYKLHQHFIPKKIYDFKCLAKYLFDLMPRKFKKKPILYHTFFCLHKINAAKANNLIVKKNEIKMRKTICSRTK